MNFFTSVGNEPVSQLVGSFQDILDYHLHCAVISENVELVSELKNKGAHIDGRDPDGNTRLISCASKGQVRWMRLLQEAGANINAQNSVGATAFSFLLREPRTVISALEILRRGADANIPDVQGRTPFRSLIEANHMITAWRVHTFCKVDMADRLGDTPFMRMIEIRDIRRAGQLLKMRANINAQNYQNQTALSKELQRQDKSFLIIQWLCQRGALSLQEREFISSEFCGKRKGVKEPHSLLQSTLKDTEYLRLKEGYQQSRFLLANRELPFSIVDKIVSFLQDAPTLATLQLVNSRVWKELSACVKSIYDEKNLSIKNIFDSFLIDTVNLTLLDLWSSPNVHPCVFINALPALKTLMLSCPVSDCCSYYLSQLTCLQSLTLHSGKNISDKNLFFLSHLTTLTNLNLGGCEEITDGGLKFLSHLIPLTSLSLNNCKKIADAGLNFLRPLNNLEFLDLSCLSITDHGLNNAAFWTALTDLTLKSLNITNQGLSQLNACLLLKRLDLHDCKRITDFSILSFFTNLTDLNLSGCSGVTDTTLYSLKSCIVLNSLNLTRCKQITDEGVSYLSYLTSLEKLDLFKCNKITNKGMLTLTKLKSLKSLELKMTCNSLVVLSSLGHLKSLGIDVKGEFDMQSLNELRHLTGLQKLTWSPATDAFLCAIKTLTSLTTLHLNNCWEVTEAGLENLSELPFLEDLTMCGVDDRSQEIIEDYLNSHLTNLKTLHIE